MNTIPVPVPPSPRALVLGGGGSVGNAWLIGVLAGLQDGGLDPTDVDLVIGTSAGATAAAQMSGQYPSREVLLTLFPSAQNSSQYF